MSDLHAILFTNEELGHIQYILSKADPTIAMNYTQGILTKIQNHAIAQQAKGGKKGSADPKDTVPHNGSRKPPSSQRAKVPARK